jgi:hypothetical protein
MDIEPTGGSEGADCLVKAFVFLHTELGILTGITNLTGYEYRLTGFEIKTVFFTVLIEISYYHCLSY